MKVPLFIVLFILGSIFSIAAYVDGRWKRKKVYYVIALCIWLLMIVLVIATLGSDS